MYVCMYVSAYMLHNMYMCMYVYAYMTEDKLLEVKGGGFIITCICIYIHVCTCVHIFKGGTQ